MPIRALKWPPSSPTTPVQPACRDWSFAAANFVTRASSLADLISFAYEVQVKQIVNAPDWLDKDRYDIDAVPEQEGVPEPRTDQNHDSETAGRSLRLTFHHDKREMSAYVLTVGKDGHKLKPTQIQGQSARHRHSARHRRHHATTWSMRPFADFTGFLQILVLDRPVVDRTGIQGRLRLPVHVHARRFAIWRASAVDCRVRATRPAQPTRPPLRLRASMTHCNKNLD